MARAANGRRTFIKFSRCKLVPLRVVYFFRQSLWGPCKAVGRYQLFSLIFSKSLLWVIFMHGLFFSFWFVPLESWLFYFFYIFSTALHLGAIILMSVVGYVVFVAQTWLTQIERQIYQTMCFYTGTDIFGRGWKSFGGGLSTRGEGNTWHIYQAYFVSCTMMLLICNSWNF